MLMIGDRKHDAQGARECGIDCLGAYIGFAAPGELEQAKATYIVHSVEEMSASCRRIWRNKGRKTE